MLHRSQNVSQITPHGRRGQGHRHPVAFLMLNAYRGCARMPIQDGMASWMGIEEAVS